MTAAVGAEREVRAAVRATTSRSSVPGFPSQQGALVERRLGRAIMPRFHAGYSVGTVAGALAGSAAVALNVPVTAHLVAVTLIVAAAVIVAVRSFVRTGRQRRDGVRSGGGGGRQQSATHAHRVD